MSVVASVKNMARLWSWWLSAASLLLASPAFCYVQTSAPGRSEKVRWQRPQVTLHWSSQGLPQGLAAADMRAALAAATAAWSSPFVACTALRVVAVEEAEIQVGGMEDGRSTVVFHSRRFCKRGVSRTGYCYDPRLAAITTLHFDAAKTHIVEADIELNAVAYDFKPPVSKVRASSERPQASLSAVLVHEIGHALGFEHVYTKAQSTARDHGGRPVPRCEGAARHLRKSAMAATMEQPVDFFRGPRPLGAVDRAGLCALYPRP